MTAFTRTWDASYVAIPADTDDVSEGAQRIRHLKTDVEERLGVDHSWDGDTEDGKHNQVTLPEQASDPTAGANEIILYAKDDGSGNTQIYSIVQGGSAVSVGGFPSGTAMLFYNNAAPTGWSVVTGKTASNHYAIRVLNTATAASGGATFAAQGHSPILNDKVPSHTHGAGSFTAASGGSHTHTGTAASSGAHTHGLDTLSGVGGTSGAASATSANVTDSATTDSNGAHTHSLSINSGGAHTHTISGTSAANGSADNWEPAYHDVILCSKD